MVPKLGPDQRHAKQGGEAGSHPTWQGTGRRHRSRDPDGTRFSIEKESRTQDGDDANRQRGETRGVVPFAHRIDAVLRGGEGEKTDANDVSEKRTDQAEGDEQEAASPMEA